MARQLLNNNSTEPLGGPNTGLGTDQGDLWNTAVSSLNAMSSELYARTGGTTTLTQSNTPRNLLDGGDFLTNPFQRGTSISGVAATAVYVADRFFMAGSVSGVSAIGAQTSFSSITGFSKALAWGRSANASSVGVISLAQVMETADSIRMAGQPICLSFWAATGANYSGGNLGVQVLMGTGTDQSAQSALAATWTGQNNVISATQALTATMTRYSFSNTVPTSATQLALQLTYTPTGSAGAADNVLLLGAQLEQGQTPSPFEHRDIEVELALCQRYCFVVNEPTSAVIIGAAMVMSTNKLNAMIPLPTPMRTAPSVTVVAGSFVFQLNGTQVTATGLTAGATHTVNMVNLVASATAASNFASMLQGGAGTGSITANADY